MGFDGLLMRALIPEMKERLLGQRVEKITQPARGVFLLGFRKTQLLISVEPASAYMSLTEEKFENPPEPPMFCMFLRKHLQGAILEAIEQEGTDRTAYFVFAAQNAAFERIRKTLVFEAMGRHANLLLLEDDEDSRGIIIDCIKRSALDSRSALPRLPYEPFEDHRKNILESLDEGIEEDIDFLRTYQGFSKLSARFASEHPDRIRELLFPWEFGGGGCCSFREDGASTDFYFLEDALRISRPDDRIESYQSLSAALNAFYTHVSRAASYKKKQEVLHKSISNRLGRVLSKIGKLEMDLEKAMQSEQFKLYGDLMLTYTPAVEDAISRHEKSLEVMDFEGNQVRLPLDLQLSAGQNAQKCYQKYKKSVSAVDNIKRQIKRAKGDAAFLENSIAMLENAESEAEVSSLSEELVSMGFLRQRRKKRDAVSRGRASSDKRRLRLRDLNVHGYRLSSGRLLLVGRSNTANDELTMKFASKTDLWLHVNTIPGSHCIIRAEGEEASDDDVLEAAQAAAYYSKARMSSKVAVDYCPVKNVRKPAGARPGMVIYDGYKTAIVNPGIDSLKKENLK